MDDKELARMQAIGLEARTQETVPDLVKRSIAVLERIEKRLEEIESRIITIERKLPTQ